MPNLDLFNIGLICLALVFVLVVYLVSTYNSIIRLNERVKEAWSGITVILKLRADLIPNLVNTVKGYAKHEKETFEEVTKARTAVMSAKSVDETAAAEQTLQGALSKIFALAEAYPELKANENFKELQSQLVDTEEKLQASRRFYNAGAREFNTKLIQFPVNILFGSNQISIVFVLFMKDFFMVTWFHVNHMANIICCKACDFNMIRFSFTIFDSQFVTYF